MKQLADRALFYVSIGILNLAVGTTFFAVTTKPPVAATVSSYSVVNQAVATRPHVVPAITGTPVRIVVPSVSVDLPVAVGSYNPSDASWTLDNTMAYYADNSLPVNDSNGRTIIYGHAQAPVFAALIYLPAEARAEVYTDNGYVFRYVYTTMKEVVPTDTTIFGADGPPTLVLQTCSGPWDAYRALYSFELEAVQKL